MWAGLDQQREQIKRAGLELAPGELLAAATGRGARLEGITAVLLLTDEDDFNALASVLLTETVEGRVFRLAPPQRSHGVVAPYTTGEILFANGMTRPAVTERYQDGARIVVHRTDGVLPAGQDLLFIVRADGQLAPSLRPARRRRSLVTPWCPWARRSRRSLRIPVIVICLRQSDDDLSCTPGQRARPDQMSSSRHSPPTPASPTCSCSRALPAAQPVTLSSSTYGPGPPTPCSGACRPSRTTATALSPLITWMPLSANEVTLGRGAFPDAA